MCFLNYSFMNSWSKFSIMSLVCYACLFFKPHLLSFLFR